MLSSSKNFLILKTLKKIEEIRDHKKYWNISWILGEKLSQIAINSKPTNILEIGTSNGFSTHWLALGSDSKITTIDVDKTRLDEAISWFKESKIDKRVKTINSEIFEFLDSSKNKDSYDFIFLDAAHKKYFEIIIKLKEKNLLKEKYVIVADNILSHSYMGEFVEKMKKDHKCELIEIDSGFLVAISS